MCLDLLGMFIAQVRYLSEAAALNWYKLQVVTSIMDLRVLDKIAAVEWWK